MLIKPLFEPGFNLRKKAVHSGNPPKLTMLLQNDQKQRWMPEHQSPFAVFFNFSGEVRLKIEGYKYQTKDSFFILDKNTSVSFSTQAEILNQNAVVAFDHKLFVDYQTYRNSTTRQLIENPYGSFRTQMEIVNRQYSFNSLEKKYLYQLLRIFSNRKSGFLSIKEEQVEAILQYIFKLNGNAYEERERISAIKASTRSEIYRRLCAARVYMRNNLERSLSLSEIAGQVQLNQYYFLRLFRDLYHQTPHQYITHLRIERACRLLSETDYSITQICELVGFESLASFSLLFKKSTGLAPSCYRK